MTVILTGASITQNTWNSINWKDLNSNVRQLQMRIAKATREKKYGKVKALQWLVTHSWSAKLLSVRRVTTNTGKRTAGVDGKLWSTARQKLDAVKQLKRRGYKPLPLRRVNIPKANGKIRKLGVPTMRDRAMQALHLLALEPISESQADPNSYGFRPKRSCHDAIEQCFIVLSKKKSAKWILEADIEGCFDNISHDWLLNNVIMDRNILSKWLKSGVMEQGNYSKTIAGTPQGGIISPTLANIALDGLEREIIKLGKDYDRTQLVRYADDFIVTAQSKDKLISEVLPVINKFLVKRNLSLSQDKTRITNIVEGFDFLGFNVRKYGDKLLIKPAKQSVLNVLKNCREIVKKHRTAKTINLINMLNPKLIGWCMYYRHKVSSKAFSYIEYRKFDMLWQWAKRRHPNKSSRWLKDKYFRQKGRRNWVFSVKISSDLLGAIYKDLFIATDVKIKRYVKVRSSANPYDPKYSQYFKQRDTGRITRL